MRLRELREVCFQPRSECHARAASEPLLPDPTNEARTALCPVSVTDQISTLVVNPKPQVWGYVILRPAA